MVIVLPTQKYGRCVQKAANRRAATIAETSTNIVQAGHEWVTASSDKLFEMCPKSCKSPSCN